MLESIVAMIENMDFVKWAYSILDVVHEEEKMVNTFG